MSLESTVQRIEIIKAKAAAAEKIAAMEFIRRQLEEDEDALRQERLLEMAGDKAAEQALNDELRREIPQLWWKLIQAPPTDTMREVNPVSSPNGTSYWRELDIKKVGRVDVRYVSDPSRDEGASYFSLEVPDLPIVEGRSRAEECVLVEFKVGQPVKGKDIMTFENDHFLHVRGTLTSICAAAGYLTSPSNS